MMYRATRWLLPSCVLFVALPTFGATPAGYSFDAAQSFLRTYCQACHQGKTPAGGFHLDRVGAKESLKTNPQKWTSLTTRVVNGEMPPKGSPAPPLDLREQFSKWVNINLRAEACATGIAPGRSLIRRLNRDEYTATIRDLDLYSARIAAAVEQQAAAAREIAGNTSAAAASVGQVNGAIVQIEAVADQTAHSANKLGAAATNVTDQTKRIRDQVKALSEDIQAISA